MRVFDAEGGDWESGVDFLVDSLEFLEVQGYGDLVGFCLHWEIIHNQGFMF